MALNRTNNEITKQIIENGSLEMKRVFDGVDLSNSKDVQDILFSYSIVKNEYITTLINKIVETRIYSKIKENPLKIFYKGLMPYGYTLEQMYVEASKGVNFNDNFLGAGGSDENDLIGKLVPKVYSNYISKNYAYKYKISISDLQLRTAFNSNDGLSLLIDQLLNANIRGAYRDEFKDIKTIIKKLCIGYRENSSAGSTADGGDKTQYLQPSQVIDTSLILDGTIGIKNLCTTLRALAGRLSFESTKYNISGLNQFSNIEDMVFITTPEVKAQIDVDFYASLFHIEKGDVKFRIVEVDELPLASEIRTKTEGTQPAQITLKNVQGILCDKWSIQAYDTLFETRVFENGDKLMMNHFLHKQGLVGGCPFVNFLVLASN